MHGLAPDIPRSLEWKELMHILNPNYNPTSAGHIDLTGDAGDDSDDLEKAFADW